MKRIIGHNGNIRDFKLRETKITIASVLVTAISPMGGFGIAPDEKTGLAEVRIWYKDILTDVYQVKNSDLNIVHF